jgi:hypothetical protein
MSFLDVYDLGKLLTRLDLNTLISMEKRVIVESDSSPEVGLLNM